MQNEVLFEEWLKGFKKSISVKKFKSVKAYLDYIHEIEKLLDMDDKSVYKLSSQRSLTVLEKKLRGNEKFKSLKEHRQHSILSALHVYQNLMEILSQNNSISNAN